MKTSPQNVSLENGNVARRTFIRSTSLALIAASLADANPALALVPQGSRPQGNVRRRPYFGQGTYSVDALDGLYGDAALERARRAGRGRRSTSDKSHMIFYYDEQAHTLVNPYNVQPSLSAAKYSMEITIRNSHVARADYDTI